MKRIIAFCLIFGAFIALASVSSFAVTEKTKSLDYSKYAGTRLHVYNWGEYISDGSEGSYDINAAFEELTGIKVIYDTYDSNESMYSIIKGGGASYDIVIPSDYMIGRMIEEDLLEPIDFSNIPNYRYISDAYRGLDYDPDDTYSVPYTCGRVGIIYNTTMIDEEDVKDESWSLLWNDKYAGKILQFNNSRDGLATAQFYLGFDVNSTDTATWDGALSLLMEQKPMLQGYVMDEIFNKMESGEAAAAPYYIGDFFTMYWENEDLAFYHPKEGTNRFFDAICIPKGSKNKEAAELYINFLLDPEIALENAEFICYETPNSAVIENPDYIEFLEEEMHEDAYELLYGESLADIPTQVFDNLDSETTAYQNACWEKLKTQDGGTSTVIYVICGVIIAIIIAVFVYQGVIKYKRRITYLN